MNVPAPIPLEAVLRALDAESEPFRQVHRLIDSIEVFVKLHTVLLVSDYFQRPGVSDALRGLLGAGLRKPSLGIWWQFARDIAAHMDEAGMEPLHPDLARAVRKNDSTCVCSMAATESLASATAAPGDNSCHRNEISNLPAFGSHAEVGMFMVLRASYRLQQRAN